MSKYRSKIAEVVHKDAAKLRTLGLVDKATMREFDALCLTTVEALSARQIRAIRTANNVSQGVFAAVLNVPSTLVSQWERGEKKPSGPSLKLLALVKSKGLNAVL